ncbi:segregation/condensation protein A [Candidatus Uhrbacteria bacterium]|nr:segregation/condensation protein A [Candidatus Uhrbacteria bacterium]
MQSITIKDFDGPLDLLLRCIEERELPITSVSIAEVAEQYLTILHTRADWDPDELADFLVIAAKLILIKSKALLPTLDLGDDEHAADALERQLKLYKAYLDASKTVAQLIARRHVTFFREAQVSREPHFTAPKQVTMTVLRSVFEHILAALEPLLPLPKSVIAKAVSLHEKMSQLRTLIMEKISLSFHTLMGSAKSKTDVIVSFLALLELVKQRAITVRQEGMFNDIHIERM